MQNEEEKFAQAKAELQKTLERCFVEGAKDTESRLNFIKMLFDFNAKQPYDAASVDIWQIVLTRLATLPTAEEIAQGLDEDARRALEILNQAI